MGDMADTVEREQPFLKPKPNPKQKLQLMLITDMVDTVDTEDMVDTVDTEDMVDTDTAVEDTADLLNLILRLKPTTVDTMVDTVVDTMVDTVDTDMVVMVDTTDKCHLSSQIFMDQVTR